jgi:hypothetical protein
VTSCGADAWSQVNEEQNAQRAVDQRKTVFLSADDFLPVQVSLFLVRTVSLLTPLFADSYLCAGALRKPILWPNL